MSRKPAGHSAPPAVGRPAFPARLKSAASSPATSPKPLPAPARRSPVNPTGPLASAGLGLDSQAIRAHMVRRLAAQGVASAEVLQAMSRIERHRFVDSALAGQAYEDTALPIGLGQTISKPSVVGRMLDLLVQGRSLPLGRVLEIGTGCGYQAALLSLLASEVYSLERLRGLHEKARENLRPLRLRNLHLLLGDGTEGYAKGAPYAAIVAAAGGRAVPSAWTEQLAVGGRLVAPIEGGDGGQVLMVIDRTSQGLRQTVLEPVHFVPLKSGVL